MTTITAFLDNLTRKWVTATGIWMSEASSPQFTVGTQIQLNLTLLNGPPLLETYTYQASLVTALSPTGTVLAVSGAEGEWDDADATESKFALTLDLNTNELYTALGELTKNRYWFVLTVEDEGVLVFTLSVPIWVWNNVSAGITTPVAEDLARRNVEVFAGQDVVIISDLGGSAVTATLEAPVGGNVNIGVSNVEVNAERTQAAVYLTSAVPTTGYILRCILYRIS